MGRRPQVPRPPLARPGLDVLMYGGGHREPPHREVPAGGLELLGRRVCGRRSIGEDPRSVDGHFDIDRHFKSVSRFLRVERRGCYRAERTPDFAATGCWCSQLAAEPTEPLDARYTLVPWEVSLVDRNSHVYGGEEALEPLDEGLKLGA